MELEQSVSILYNKFKTETYCEAEIHFYSYTHNSDLNTIMVRMFKGVKSPLYLGLQYNEKPDLILSFCYLQPSHSSPTP